MKKKNKYPTGSRNRAGIFSSEPYRQPGTKAGQAHTGGQTGTGKRVTGQEGNIYGEHEEDFYSHAPGA